MKYLKIFNNETEYSNYKNSDDFINPNVSLILENDKISINNDNLKFPITLTEGNNGELGVLLYNYICKNYAPELSFEPFNERVYLVVTTSEGQWITGQYIGQISTIGNYNYTYGKRIQSTGIRLIPSESSGESGLTLDKNGFVGYYTYSPPLDGPGI